MSRLLLTLVFAVFMLSACSDNKQDKTVTPAPVAPRPQILSAQQNADKIFTSVQSVLSGYQAYSGKLPLKLQDLDAGDYMFDSKYLAEILPEGFDLYLALAAEPDATLMWLQQPGENIVLSRSLAAPQLSEVRVEKLKALTESGQVVARVGRLTQIQLPN